VELFPYGTGSTPPLPRLVPLPERRVPLSPRSEGPTRWGVHAGGGNRTTHSWAGAVQLRELARAVRAGRTFMTTVRSASRGRGKTPATRSCSPGRRPGRGAAGARSFVPFHRVEIVLNGQASRRGRTAGDARADAAETVRVPGPGGWRRGAPRASGRRPPGDSESRPIRRPIYFHVPTRELFLAPPGRLHAYARRRRRDLVGRWPPDRTPERLSRSSRTCAPRASGCTSVCTSTDRALTGRSARQRERPAIE